MQSVMPLLTHHLSPAPKANYCEVGSCSGMCEGKCMCAVNGHSQSSAKSSQHKICGCTHHDEGSSAVSVTSVGKAILAGLMDVLPPSSGEAYILLKELETNIFAEDIFHPPRIIA
jgi:hypothetical protein